MPFLTHRQFQIFTFSFLNLIRLVTVSALCIGFAGQVLLLVNELKMRIKDGKSDMGIDTSADGAFYFNTDLVVMVGGVAGFAVAHIVSAILIFLGLLSELPSPPSFNLKVQTFWSRAFPSFGTEHGKGVLGLLILLIGSFELAQNVDGLPRVAAWFLFTHGIFNLILGVTLGSDVHSRRSLSYLKSSPSSISDLESQKSSSPPQIITTSFSDSSPSPRSPLQVLNLHKLSRFNIPSWRRSGSVQSASIYSHTHSDIYQEPHPQQPSRARSTLSRDPSTATGYANHRTELWNQRNQQQDTISGYMSEIGGSDNGSPVSMQQSFHPRDLDRLGPMHQVRR